MSDSTPFYTRLGPGREHPTPQDREVVDHEPLAMSAMICMLLVVEGAWGPPYEATRTRVISHERITWFSDFIAHHGLEIMEVGHTLCEACAAGGPRGSGHHAGAGEQ